MKQQSQDVPWIDFRLKKEMMDYLWSIIDNTINVDLIHPYGNKTPLAGNISKSVYIQDKDNCFFENVLTKMSEQLYYKNWNNYYDDVVITRSKPDPKFRLNRLWVNYQKQNEFNPPHNHSGEFSFVVFMKIPTHWKEQHALPFVVNSNEPSASNFQFLLGYGEGPFTYSFPLSPEDEGRMLFFPAWLVHQVFPFYGTEKERITISGNIGIPQKQITLSEKEKKLEEMEKQVTSLKEVIQHEKENDEEKTNSERV